MAEEIEVFQDLNLRGPITRRAELSQSAWKFGSDSLLMKFGRRLVLVS
jgi:hypothetical protein